MFKGLAAVGTAEADIALIVYGANQGSRPTTPASPRISDERITNAIASLTPYLGQEKSSGKMSEDDSFMVRVTIAACYFLAEQWQQVKQTLTKDEWSHVLRTPSSGISPTTRLSIFMAALLLGVSQLRSGAKEEATETFQGALPYMTESEQVILQHKELHRWAARLSTQLCLLAAGLPQEKLSIKTMNDTLLEYRSWSVFSSNAPAEASPLLSATSNWDAYHRLVSDILRSNIVYSGPSRAPLALAKASMPRRLLTSMRIRQFAELQSVERAYEQHLMRTTSFPKANRSNTNVEIFVDRALTNWRIITSSEWANADLGEGGKLAYSRNVLEVLYRAASKTFHSTPILRHLFSVHAQLGEFELAIRAFDAYTEIVTKGKARAEKTGKHEVGLDDDDMVLRTAAEAVKVLCLYGENNEAEKAYEIGQLISTWLRQRRPRSSSSATAKNFDPALAAEKVMAETFSTPSARAAAYRAIGQSEATWARYAFDSLNRQELQDRALDNLRRSISISSSEGVDLETSYMLAYLLAEKRQTKAALETLRDALASDQIFTPTRILANPAEERFQDRRRRFHLMHLFVLLLSARGEHDAAYSLCEVTIEQLVDAARSCSEAESFDNADGGDGDRHSRDLPTRMTDYLEDAEKEAFLQMKITEIELLVLLDNSPYISAKRQELVKMYEQLFGNPASPEEHKSNAANVNSLPKSRAGTIKSFRHSVFGRPKPARRSFDSSTFEQPPAPNAGTTNQQTPLPNPPSVTVTDTDGEKGGEEDHRGKMSKLSMSIRRGKQRHTHDLRKMASEELLSDRRAFSDPPPVPSLSNGLGGRSVSNADLPAHTIDNPRSVSGASTDESAGPTVVDDSDRHHANGIDSGDGPSQELRIVEPTQLPTRVPPPMFSRLARSTHYISVLVEVWLFVSELYMREDLTKDAAAAIDEAEKLVEVLKNDAAAVESSGRAWIRRGWGLGKSIARLLGDIWAQVQSPLLALLSPSPCNTNTQSKRGATYPSQQSPSSGPCNSSNGH